MMYSSDLLYSSILTNNSFAQALSPLLKRHSASVYVRSLRKQNMLPAIRNIIIPIIISLRQRLFFVICFVFFEVFFTSASLTRIVILSPLSFIFLTCFRHILLFRLHQEQDHFCPKAVHLI